MAALVPGKDTKSTGRNYTTPGDATLEADAAALTRHSRPIPYALRDELALMRLTRDR